MKNQRLNLAFLIFVGLFPAVITSLSGIIVNLIGNDLAIVIAVFAGICLIWNIYQTMRPVLLLAGLESVENFKRDSKKIFIGAIGMFLFLTIRIFFIN